MAEGEDRRKEMREAIERGLSPGGARKLPLALAALYEESRRPRRLARLHRAQLVNAVTALLSAGIEGYDQPALAPIVLPVCAGLSALFLASAAVLRRTRRRWLEDAVFVLPHLFQMLVIEAAGQAMPARLADRYMLAAACAIAATLSVNPLRVRTATLLAYCSIAFYPLVLLVVPGPLGLPRDMDVPLVGCGGIAVALLVAHRNEMERRRDFLMALRHDQTLADMTVLNAQLERLSNTDALTGVANRRQLERELASLWAAQPAVCIGLALVDIDHFKKFNDSAGHAAGDQCLRQVAQALAGVVRGSDLAARYGGEEFAIVLHDVDWAQLLITGERLREAVAALELPHPGLPGEFLGISIGVAHADATARGGRPQDLVAAADGALYAAKHAGRNCMATAGAPPAGAGERAALTGHSPVPASKATAERR